MIQLKCFHSKKCEFPFHNFIIISILGRLNDDSVHSPEGHYALKLISIDCNVFRYLPNNKLAANISTFPSFN
ncbi:hypothetical protein C0J52_14310 [Blattella germanica]|nr:hypothetical protein C0J52_14310 [Blattella germanica]